MTTDEAREAAWNQLGAMGARGETRAWRARDYHRAGWDARGQHDKEQIAAMAEMLEVAASLIRALAGQSEEATE